MRILHFLARNPEGAGVAELAVAVDLPTATVYRILATLCAHRAVC
ncbi:MAG: helix-turn-helix domain-containing protein, partial [Planctomycetota bacterium]|nr:helix-turn-helix domain-containing protein [Planctomycetota bacterium]